MDSAKTLMSGEKMSGRCWIGIGRRERGGGKGERKGGEGRRKGGGRRGRKERKGEGGGGGERKEKGGEEGGGGRRGREEGRGEREERGGEEERKRGEFWKKLTFSVQFVTLMSSISALLSLNIWQPPILLIQFLK